MRRNPWFSAGYDLFSLGFEASSVVALRAIKVAAGGASADRESKRMVDEKIESVFELQALFLTGRLGLTAPGALRQTITHYRRKVRANRRRLSGE